MSNAGPAAEQVRVLKGVALEIPVLKLGSLWPTDMWNEEESMDQATNVFDGSSESIKLHGQ